MTLRSILIGSVRSHFHSSLVLFIVTLEFTFVSLEFTFVLPITLTVWYFLVECDVTLVL